PPNGASTTGWGTPSTSRRSVMLRGYARRGPADSRATTPRAGEALLSSPRCRARTRSYGRPVAVPSDRQATTMIRQLTKHRRPSARRTLVGFAAVTVTALALSACAVGTGGQTATDADYDADAELD